MTHKKVAVIGYPVKHSLSPVLHGYWLKKYNIDGEYGMLEVKPEDLEQTLLGLKDKGYVGCNLTIPHKEAAFELVDKQTSVSFRGHEPTVIKAINTILVENDGTLTAANTDVYGFIQNIKESEPNFNFTKGSAVVLGAGGAARSIVYGLIQRNVPNIFIVNRTRRKSDIMVGDLEYFTGFNGNNSKLKALGWNDRNEILADANLLVNTTSLGMKGNPELDINLEKLPKNALVTDIVYSPIEVDPSNPTYTKLLKNASARGNLVVEGLGMLLYQAVAGFQMWFGVKPEVTEDLRKHVLSHIK
ncbi:MAG: shikimate dehydrogenase [Rickettsiales bacterium]|nr:shikimate dehydrogenase [Pseudomonadota bacterium]MDA0965815.1 shikimate dehydrogenase [Pseudomonadota bacterium]MDG4542715.1 shikimate dehydrogenase [Rickettsiales bacterium]MDG4545219.1 shikimate dehydrogenase [Rickettsiales bacterium]MDG4547342.1 shikimate dehydrogenase [Rickettsiales bacterium]